MGMPHMFGVARLSGPQPHPPDEYAAGWHVPTTVTKDVAWGCAYRYHMSPSLHWIPSVLYTPDIHYFVDSASEIWFFIQAWKPGRQRVLHGFGAHGILAAHAHDAAYAIASLTRKNCATSSPCSMHGTQSSVAQSTWRP